jgi:hypothetical protein
VRKFTAKETEEEPKEERDQEIVESQKLREDRESWGVGGQQ